MTREANAPGYSGVTDALTASQQAGFTAAERVAAGHRCPWKGSLLFLLMTVAMLLSGTLPAQSAADNQAGEQEGAAEEVKVLDEIVAKVNNEIITLTDLNKSLGQLNTAIRQEHRDPQEAQRAFERRRRQLLRTMIQTKIMVQRAEELGLAADIDLDVSKYLEEMRKEAGIPSLDILDQYLRERGSSLAEYRQNVKEQLITRALLGNFVYSKITLLTEEIRSFYENNQDRFRVPAEVRLAEILFLTEGKNRAEVRQSAEEALAKLKDGAAFDAVAREYSEGPTASRGGDIGEFQKGSMNPAIEEVVFDLPVGDFSEIIESSYGFQIVRVIDRKPPSVLPLEEVRPQIAEALYERKAEPEVQEYLKNLFDESYVYVNPKYTEQYDLSGLGL